MSYTTRLILGGTLLGLMGAMPLEAAAVAKGVSLPQGRFRVQTITLELGQLPNTSPVCVQLGVFFDLLDAGPNPTYTFDQFEFGLAYPGQPQPLMTGPASVFGANANGGGLTRPPTVQRSFDGDMNEACAGAAIVNAIAAGDPDIDYVDLGMPINGPESSTGDPVQGGALLVRNFGNIGGAMATLSPGQSALLGIISAPIERRTGEIEFGFPPVPTNFVHLSSSPLVRGSPDLIRTDNGNLELQTGVIRVVQPVVTTTHPVPALGSGAAWMLVGLLALVARRRLRAQ